MKWESSLKSAKVSTPSTDLVVDAILEANDPIMRSFPVDENLYGQQEELAQPLEALDDYEIQDQLRTAGLSEEENQVIVDAIAEANFEAR